MNECESEQTSAEVGFPWRSNKDQYSQVDIFNYVKQNDGKVSFLTIFTHLKVYVGIMEQLDGFGLMVAKYYYSFCCNNRDIPVSIDCRLSLTELMMCDNCHEIHIFNTVWFSQLNYKTHHSQLTNFHIFHNPSSIVKAYSIYNDQSKRRICTAITL